MRNCYSLGKFLVWTFFAWFLTFTIILPFLAQKWVYSPYFYTSDDLLLKAPGKVDDLNLKRYQEAQNYLMHLNSEKNIPNYFDVLQTESTIELVIMVITKRRMLTICDSDKYWTLECEPHYLQQVLAAVDKENKAYSDSSKWFPVIICNVDSDSEYFQDLITLNGTFPIINRYEHTTELNSEKRTQETSDYAFCLESILNRTLKKSPKYTLVIEDDALMFPNFFSNLFHILDFRIKAKIREDELVTWDEWSFVKLYHPEMWSGFAWESPRLSELLIVALLGGTSGVLIFSKFAEGRNANLGISHLFVFIVYAFYWTLIAIVISRQALLQIGRINPAFLKMSPAPGCCTPAMVYPTNKLAEIVKYLRSSNCHECSNGVDLALDDFSQLMDLKSYLIEPNLVKHIGMHSTLTGSKNAVQMLFYDLLYE